MSVELFSQPSTPAQKRLCASLPPDDTQASYSNAYSEKAKEGQRGVSSPSHPFTPSPKDRHGDRISDVYGVPILLTLMFIGACCGMSGGLIIGFSGGTSRKGWILAALGAILWFTAILSAAVGCLPWNWVGCLCDGQEHSQYEHFHGAAIVSQLSDYKGFRELPSENKAKPQHLVATGVKWIPIFRDSTVPTQGYVPAILSPEVQGRYGGRLK
jgi:hypothetical protein